MARVSARAGHRVALTFDAEHPDRPATPGGHDRLLDALDDLDVRATFFLQGRWVEAFPATAHRIADGGHLVGNHSHYHARMQFLSAAGLRHDIALAEAAIRNATSADPRPWFRCPFGGGAADARVLGALASAGYRHVGWSASPQDWDDGPDRPELATLIADEVRLAPDDAIVLLHTWPDRTAAQLPAIIRRLREDGAKLVRVDELGSITAAPGREA